MKAIRVRPQHSPPPAKCSGSCWIRPSTLSFPCLHRVATFPASPPTIRFFWSAPRTCRPSLCSSPAPPPRINRILLLTFSRFTYKVRRSETTTNVRTSNAIKNQLIFRFFSFLSLLFFSCFDPSFDRTLFDFTINSMMITFY